MNTQSIISRIQQPILGALLLDRNISRALVAGISAHGLAVAFGWTGFDCPIRAATGVPCPGCGLSRASAMLVQGQWGPMAQYHLFAPFFALAFILMSVAIVLPTHLQVAFATWVANAEQQTGIVAIALILFVVYWLVRLLWLRESFIKLILN